MFEKDEIVTLVARDVGYREYEHVGLRLSAAESLMLLIAGQNPGMYQFTIKRAAKPAVVPVAEPPDAAGHVEF